MKHNGREQADEKRYVFVCRLTDGRLAALPQGSYDMPEFFHDIVQLKSRIMLTVPEFRIPVYEQYELNDLKAELEGQPADEAASA